ncbi:MAG: ATP-dependent DNA helicase RecG, partial [Bacilli bacterium]|nr:ATP-dependent DNA helicase RecG [Bacilli bacterium]
EYITPRQAQHFKKHNILTVEDLLLNFPTKFDDYTIINIKDATPEVPLTIAGVVQTKGSVTTIKSKLTLMNFYADIDGRRIRVSIFNRHFLKSRIFYGVYVRLTGKFNANMKSFTASEISFEELSNSITPVFNIKGIANNKVLEIKERVFEEYGDRIKEIIPEEILERQNLISRYQAIKYINIPEDASEIRLAIKRIKFEELLLYQLKVKYLLYMRKHHPQGVALNFDREKVNKFIANLPFVLTEDQKQAVKDILGDLSSNYKMNRLLQGEVGSGKTVVAAISLYAAITAGYQGAIMVPTEVLAQQHYKTLLDLFKDEDIAIEMLSASRTAKDRKEILGGLITKEIDIVIGTHSLFGKDVEFERLGLVITDEEHRFGVKQRVSIVGKGHLIDHLKMSATPIPRTLAISVLGESDISVIKTLPGNRKDPITKYLKYQDFQLIDEHILKELKAGHQIYIITPMIEESEVMELENATDIYEKVKLKYQGICEVGLIHSRLKNQEKEQVMQDYSENNLHILVSTSVIEVGVNIINATTEVILDADRFGIAQLHQMRGRVRRSDEQAYCFLVSDSTAETAIARLKLIEENNDGFVLAEEDLLIRGPGDLFGEKQSGNIIFKMADIVLDRALLEEVNLEATDIIKKEKFLTEEYKVIYEIIDKNYLEKKEMLE